MTYKKAEDYEAKSLSLAREAEESLKIACAAATRKISEFNSEGVEMLIDLARNGLPEDSVKLQALKHALKLGGMEIERQEVTQKTITITEEHAAKIRKAAEKLQQ